MACRPLLVALAAAVLAASCTAGSPGVVTEQVDQPDIADPPPDPPDDSDPPRGTESPNASDPPVATGDVPVPTTLRPRGDTGVLDWSPCPPPGGALLVFECSTLQVPLDHDDPDGAQIDLAVSRARVTGADEDRIGSLVINPGGPGGSGVDALVPISFVMSDAVTSRFDLVGFDPRGVGGSSALDCDADRDDDIAYVEDGDAAAWEAAVAENAARLATCTSDTLALAPYVGTNNAARDLDLLRAALGDDQLTYLGYSYGTRLGAVYAELFPGNVRALVLDGGVKPESSNAELNREQGAGFDNALENFADACDRDVDCPLRDVGPTLTVIDELAAEVVAVGEFPTDSAERVLTPGEFGIGIAGALYSKQTWQYLASALSIAKTDQDGTLLQVLGDQLVGRNPDGTYDNSTIASTFINCADDPTRFTVDEQRAVADEAADASRWFEGFLRGSTGCLGIAPAIDPLAIGPAMGAAPMVVIGTTGDPATPYDWSVELAGLLDSAVLYTVEAEGHTAYGSIDCVQPAIDAYLIDLVVPAVASSCSDSSDAVGGTDFFLPPGESDVDQVLAFFDCVRDNGVDLPPIGAAEVLADPTLESVLELFDLGDPALQLAFVACADLIPQI